MNKRTFTGLLIPTLVFGMAGCGKRPVHQSNPGVENSIVRFSPQAMASRDFDAIVADPKTQSISLAERDCISLHREGSMENAIISKDPMGYGHSGYALSQRNYTTILLESSRGCQKVDTFVTFSLNSNRSCVKLSNKDGKPEILACAEGKKYNLYYRELYP